MTVPRPSVVQARTAALSSQIKRDAEALRDTVGRLRKAKDHFVASGLSQSGSGIDMLTRGDRAALRVRHNAFREELLAAVHPLQSNAGGRSGSGTAGIGATGRLTAPGLSSPAIAVAAKPASHAARALPPWYRDFCKFFESIPREQAALELGELCRVVSVIAERLQCALPYEAMLAGPRTCLRGWTVPREPPPVSAGAPAWGTSTTGSSLSVSHTDSSGARSVSSIVSGSGVLVGGTSRASAQAAWVPLTPDGTSRFRRAVSMLEANGRTCLAAVNMTRQVTPVAPPRRSSSVDASGGFSGVETPSSTGQVLHELLR